MANSLGDWVTSPLANLLMTYLGGQDLSKAQGKANQANEQRYQDILGILNSREKSGMKLANSQAADEKYAANRSQGDIQNLFGRLQGQLGGAYGNRTQQGMGFINPAGVLDPFEQEMQGIAQGYGSLGSDIQNRLMGGGAELNAGYAQRRQSALDALQGFGEQAKADISKQFDNAGAAANQDLVSRGLTGSTVSANTKQGFEREKSSELRRLEDDLRSQRINLDTSLEGERLAQQERNLGQQTAYGANIGQAALGSRSQLADARANFARALGLDQFGAFAGLTGDQLGSQERLAQTGLGYYAGSEADKLNTQRRINDRTLNLNLGLPMDKAGFMERREDVYPQSNWYLDMAQRYGQNSAQPPQPKTDWFSPVVGAAGQIGGGFAMSKMFWGCIDGNAEIMTPNGGVRLALLGVGSSVVCPDGAVRTIINYDFGDPDTERRGDYIKLVTDAGRIVCTKDHIIGGKPAGEWKSGETMEAYQCTAVVQEVEPIHHVRSGDLEIEGGYPYIANGFIVSSMIGKPRAVVQRPITEPQPIPSFRRNSAGRKPKKIVPAE